MQDFSKQRTYAIIGHGGTGKTSVAEMILFRSGAVNRQGKIEEGTTTLDFEPEEIKRRGSIQPGFAHYDWKKNEHFLIDTPGDTNFTGDLSYLLTAADGVLFVIDAIDGVKPLTRRIWDEVTNQGLPAVVFINKMDRERANFDMALSSLSEVLRIKPVLMNLPIGAEAAFKGVVDVLSGKALFFNEKGESVPGEIPEDLQDMVESLRETSVENIAESDDQLMEKYLEEGTLSADEIQQGLRIGIMNRTLVPVCVGSALQNKGGTELLDIIQSLLPSPLDHKPWIDAKENQRPSSPDQPAALFVFKTLADPFAGQLSVVRVLSGTIAPDTTLLNPKKENKEKLGQILLLEGKKQNTAKSEMGPGAVFAVAKLKNTSTGDTLCDEKNPFVLPTPELPPNLLSYALAPAVKGEEDKVFAAVHKLLDEDINLRLTRSEETGDMLLSGMGQMHIEISVEKAKRRNKLDILLKTPKVPYRETIKGRAEVQGRYKKQTGGRGQFGDCWIKLEPKSRGEGYEFVDAIVGGSIPRQYIPAVDKGIQEASIRGLITGNPVVDFKVTLFDGSYHNVDSSEMAFKVAGSLAFKKAAEQAGVVLLEPIMTMKIYVPDEYMGDVIGDISSRRGKVLGSDSKGGNTEIKVHVPMSEVLKYAPDLRSMTGGQGTFTMEFDHYEEAPPQVAEKVIAEARTPAEE
jgi:elongation factor G